MLGQEGEIEIVEGDPGGHLYEVTTPAGNRIWLTPEEEAQAVKEALTEGVIYKINRTTEIEKAAISSIGTAVGLAVGGFFVGWLLGRKG